MAARSAPGPPLPAHARLPAILALSALLALPALLPAGGARAAEAGLGLDLQAPDAGPVERPVVDLSIANPHDMPCGDCHLPATAGGGEGALKSGDDSIGLCQGCHPGSNLHPVGIPLAEGMAPPGDAVPLGSGRFAGKIVCLTCHRLHAPRPERHLLRSPGGAGARRSESLCAACHGRRLSEKSPHQRAGDTCRLCHMNEPRPGSGPQTLGAGVQAVCNFCHSALDDQHFRSLNPFNDEYLFWDRDSPEFPRIDGRFTCVTCHDPHAAGGRRKLLREAYVNLAGLSRKINPHWRNVMCVACHDGEPRRGEPALKEGGDLTRLCYRCHGFKYSRADIHPVNVLPSRLVTVPPEMPLKDGRVTCSTCHDSSLQEGGERADSARRDNPKFLRGGFTTRNEFCLRCHTRGLMGVLNPHDQVDSRGKKDPIRCLFCHSSTPEGMVGWMVRHRQFDEVSVNRLCLLCHPAAYQDAHPIADHFVQPSSSVLKALESAEERLGIAFPLVGDTVVCITCHDPHQEGVTGETPAAGGQRSSKRLRIGAEICRGCHLDR